MRNARSAAMARLRARPPAGSVMFTSLGGAMVIALGWVSPAALEVNPGAVVAPGLAEPQGVAAGVTAPVSCHTRIDVIDEPVDAAADGTVPSEDPALPSCTACAPRSGPAVSGTELGLTVLTDPDIPPGALMVVMREDAARIASEDPHGPAGAVTAHLPVTVAAGMVAEVYGARFAVTSADELPPPLARIPRDQWQSTGHGLEAMVDLRSLLDPITVSVTSPAGAESATVYLRYQGEPRWAPVGPTCRALLAVWRGTAVEAVAVARGGLNARGWLRPGENTLRIGEPARVRIGVQGVPEDMPSWWVQVNLCLLSRREPSLDGVVPTTDAFWPTNVQDALQLALDHACGTMFITNGAGLFEAPCRGSYLALPILHVGMEVVPLLDAAVRVEVTTPGDSFAANIRIDPARARAALR